jgi:hypothetical protein
MVQRISRRPLRSRNAAWAAWLAQKLARAARRHDLSRGPGWRGIRRRKQHIEALLGDAIAQLRAEGHPVNGRVRL